MNLIFILKVELAPGSNIYINKAMLDMIKSKYPKNLSAQKQEKIKSVDNEKKNAKAIVRELLNVTLGDDLLMRMTCKEISKESGFIPIPDKIRNAIECKPPCFNNIKNQHCFYVLKMFLGPLLQTYSIFLEAK